MKKNFIEFIDNYIQYFNSIEDDDIISILEYEKQNISKKLDRFFTLKTYIEDCNGIIFDNISYSTYKKSKIELFFHLTSDLNSSDYLYFLSFLQAANFKFKKNHLKNGIKFVAYIDGIIDWDFINERYNFILDKLNKISNLKIIKNEYKIISKKESDGKYSIFLDNLKNNTSKYNNNRYKEKIISFIRYKNKIKIISEKNSYRKVRILIKNSLSEFIIDSTIIPNHIKDFFENYKCISSIKTKKNLLKRIILVNELDNNDCVLIDNECAYYLNNEKIFNIKDNSTNKILNNSEVLKIQSYIHL